MFESFLYATLVATLFLVTALLFTLLGPGAILWPCMVIVLAYIIYNHIDLPEMHHAEPSPSPRDA